MAKRRPPRTQRPPFAQWSADEKRDFVKSVLEEPGKTDYEAWAKEAGLALSRDDMIRIGVELLDKLAGSQEPPDENTMAADVRQRLAWHILDATGELTSFYDDLKRNAVAWYGRLAGELGVKSSDDIRSAAADGLSSALSAFNPARRSRATVAESLRAYMYQYVRSELLKFSSGRQPHQSLDSEMAQRFGGYADGNAVDPAVAILNESTPDIAGKLRQGIDAAPLDSVEREILLLSLGLEPLPSAASESHGEPATLEERSAFPFPWPIHRVVAELPKNKKINAEEALQVKHRAWAKVLLSLKKLEESARRD